jgi:hypothetical protein
MFSNFPLPNLDGAPIILERGHDNMHNWFREEGIRSFREDHPFFNELPKGWGNPWPDLPNPDEDHSEFLLDNIRLSIKKNRCAKPSLLGYYLSWHIIGVSFQNENGRPPRDGAELKSYNDRLPEENRYGIHICCKTVENYINKFSTDGIDPAELPFYKEYCTFLTLVYVIAHEWGHYRSEVLSFQLTNFVKSVTGLAGSNISPSYLSYFVNKKRYPLSNFEEVFAEWASLKVGIFSYHMKKPAFAKKIPNWPTVEATVKFMLTRAISRPSRIRPYSDIRYWIDFNNITSSEIMDRLSQNSRSLNRSVNDNTKLGLIKSFKNGKIVDLLMHNQMQFSTGHNFNGIVESAPLAFPYHPDSIFYDFGDDECLETHKSALNSDKFLRIENQRFSVNDAPNVYKAIQGLKAPRKVDAVLPIKVFSQILPLDPIYFHV